MITKWLLSYIGGTDNSGCVDDDDGEGTSADGVRSASGGGYVIDVGWLVCKLPDEKSTLSGTQRFQLLMDYFKPEGGSEVPLAYQEENRK